MGIYICLEIVGMKGAKALASNLIACYQGYDAQGNACHGIGNSPS